MTSHSKAYITDSTARLSPTQEQQTLTTKAYDAIIDLILSYQLRPGERTSVSRLAERLNLGRTPVKEAIIRLESDGLLSVSSRSHTTVKEIDATTASQLFALRRNLEKFAVDDAVKYATTADFEHLETLLSQLQGPPTNAGTPQQRISHYVRSNVAFHAAIVGCAKNTILDHLYAQVQLQAQIVIYLYRLESRDVGKAMNSKYLEHLNILNAFKKRDTELLKQLLDEHAKDTENSIVSALERL